MIRLPLKVEQCVHIRPSMYTHIPTNQTEEADKPDIANMKPAAAAAAAAAALATIRAENFAREALSTLDLG